jgi:hypothetical protein
LLVVLTGYDREKFPREAAAGPALHYEAVAFALEPDGNGMRLRTGFEREDKVPLEAFSLGKLRRALEADDWQAARWRLPDMGWLELQRGRL